MNRERVDTVLENFVQRTFTLRYLDCAAEVDDHTNFRTNSRLFEKQKYDFYFESKEIKTSKESTQTNSRTASN